MTSHADVIRQVWSKPRRVHDVKRLVLLRARTFHCDYVSSSRAVAVFTADRKFRKWRAFKLSVCICNRIRPSAVAKNATCLNRAIEAEIDLFIAGRRAPDPWLHIERLR